MHYQLDFNPQRLSEAPEQLLIGPWQVHYQAFARDAADQRAPVLLLGGAFQSFRSFASEIETLLDEHPVLLIDLPSQGCNEQQAPDLTLEDLADLLNASLAALDVTHVKAVGLSYGSALAALFAVRHPARCERLLLAGVTQFGRDGSRRLLEQALALLERGELEAFANGALAGLINHLALAQTDVSAGFRKALHRQILRMDDSAQQRYRQNSHRLLSFQGFSGYPQCPTLVFTGEYDHFTQPWENAAFAANCAQAEAYLIHKADHLAQFEQRDACLSLYGPFLHGLPVSAQAPHTSRINLASLDGLERRQEPHITTALTAELSHPTLGVFNAQFAQINYFGGLLRAELPPCAATLDWTLRCPALGEQSLALIRPDAHGATFVFTHLNPETDAQLQRWLSTQHTEAALRASA
ncbi:alpha/beta fold hydrolase [Atopomonas sediminilitoris]|uniref:alpha/beta fold hydrolase n=1 Tax=Atopomonas sediminilitoris TaxID=2919919 RepID=UPI0035220F6A